MYMSGSKAQAYGVTTKETLSVNELHRRLGHVSHERARLLVKKGLIEGVELEEGSEVVSKLGSGYYGVDRRCGGAEVKGVAELVESGVETEIRS